VFDNYIDRVVIKSVNAMTPKWSKRLAAFDVYIWDQCYSREQSLRIDYPTRLALLGAGSSRRPS
jgi:hypothetical protein